MLYDKRWDSKKNASEDISREFSLRGLIAWLETKNPGEEYCYSDSGRCLAAQFNEHCGREYRVRSVGHADFLSGNESFDEVLESIAVTCSAVGGPTFGAALSRARKIAESA